MTSERERFTATLDEWRANARVNGLASLVGLLVAVLIAQATWLGFVVGGAIAGIGQRTVPRGVGAGALVGILSWGGFAGLLAYYGNLADALGMGQILAVSVAIPVAYGTLGGLVRGVV